MVKDVDSVQEIQVEIFVSSCNDLNILMKRGSFCLFVVSSFNYLFCAIFEFMFFCFASNFASLAPRLHFISCRIESCFTCICLEPG